MAGTGQTITCRAAVCWGPGEAVKMEEIQVEGPKKDEVRIRMLCASICHTDLLFQGGFPLGLFPRVFGHEGVGIVESIGEGTVTSLKLGDTVVPAFVGHCGECLNCVSGKTNVCFRYPLPLLGLMTTDQTSRMSIRGQTVYHAFTCSTFSEYTVAEVSYVAKVDPSVPPPVASLISCGFSTGFGAVWKEAKVEKGASVAVFGLGAVGLGAVAGSRLQGASRIIGIDINQARKATAVDFGMTDFVNPTDESTAEKRVSEVVKEMTGGLGVDYSFECSGANQMICEALSSTVPGRGMAVVLGAAQEKPSIDYMDMIAGKTLKGSVFGGIWPQHDIPQIVHKCLTKELQLEGMITHELDFSEITTAFEILKQPDCVKVVLRFDGGKVVD